MWLTELLMLSDGNCSDASRQGWMLCGLELGNPRGVGSFSQE